MKESKLFVEFDGHRPANEHESEHRDDINRRCCNRLSSHSSCLQSPTLSVGMLVYESEQVPIDAVQ